MTEKKQTDQHPQNSNTNEDHTIHHVRRIRRYQRSTVHPQPARRTSSPRKVTVEKKQQKKHKQKPLLSLIYKIDDYISAIAKLPQHWSIIITGGCTSLIVFFPTLLFFSFFLFFQFFDLIFPGIYVGETYIGAMSIDQAEKVLDQAWNIDKTIFISDGERTWSAKPSEFGLWLDPQETTEQAYKIGRGFNGLLDAAQIILKRHRTVSPIVTFQPELAYTILETGTTIINSPPQEATVYYENDKWLILPGKPGKVLNLDKTLTSIADNPSTVLSSSLLTLEMDNVPPQLDDPKNAYSLLEDLASLPVHFNAYDPITNEYIDWSVSKEILASWLLVVGDNQNPHLQISEELITEYIAEKSKALEPEKTVQEPNIDSQEILTAWNSQKPYTFIIYYNPTTYTVQAGERLTKIGLDAGMPYWKILEANPGIDPENLQTGQTLTIPSKNEMLPLPIIIDKRIVVSISQQRMRTYQDGNLLNEHIISTGIESSPTHPGVFQVQTHELNAYASVWDLYMPHFMGIYEGWPGFMNGIHGLPTLSSGRRLWANVLGKPASYGCIIMTLDEAETLYNWAEEGVIVEINP